MQPNAQQVAEGHAALTGGMVARGIALLVCATVFLLTGVLDVKGGYVALVTVAICAVVLLWRFSQQSLGAVLIFSTSTLYVVPLISLIYIRQPIALSLFPLFVIVAFAMASAGSRVERMIPPTGDRVGVRPNFLMMVGLLVVGVIAAFYGEGAAQPIFTAFLALALVNLERIYWANASKTIGWIALAVYVIVIGFYATFLWDGFGRIVIISFLLLPVLVSMRYRLFKLNPILLAGGGGLLVFVGRVLRFGVSEGIAGIADDSGATHLILSSELLSNHSPNASGTTLFEQFQLFFLNWFPREVWPNKPININSLFVDSYIGRTGYSDDFSTALGFFGEQIYLAGPYWFLTMLLTGIVVVALRALIARMAQPYYASIVIYDVWIITLFWGGMASFAARAWFAIIPLMLYVVFLKSRKKLGRVDKGQPQRN